MPTPRARPLTPVFSNIFSCARPDLALELELPGSFRAPEGGVRAPEATPNPKVLQLMPKRTWQPNRLKRKRTHGFLKSVKPLSLAPPSLRTPCGPLRAVCCSFPQAHEDRLGPQDPWPPSQKGPLASRRHLSPEPVVRVAVARGLATRALGISAHLLKTTASRHLARTHGRRAGATRQLDTSPSAGGARVCESRCVCVCCASRVSRGVRCCDSVCSGLGAPAV